MRSPWRKLKVLSVLSAGLLGWSVPVSAADPVPAAPTTVSSAPAQVGDLLFPSAHTGDGCSSCGGCDSCCKCCGPISTFWVDAEYLLWAVQGATLPPLVTASPAGTVRTSSGVIGQPGTVVLNGDDRNNNNVRSGFRVRAGMWLGCDQTFGIEGGYFFLGHRSSGQSFGSDGSAGSAQISRPFFNTVTGLNDAELVSFPGILAGNVTVNSSSKFNGANATGRANLCCGCNYRIDALAGYQYLQLEDTTTITENLTAIDPNNRFNVPVGTTILVQDSFRTRNDFHGGTVGLAGEVRRGKWLLDFRGSLGLGVTHHTVDINGATTVTTPDGTVAVNGGGLLAQPSNIGHFTSDSFSVVPEIGLKVGYQVSEHVRALLGYNFLYWTDVTRPGGVIDLNIDPRQLPPATAVGTRPAVLDNHNDIWVQGITAGLEFRY